MGIQQGCISVAPRLPCSICKQEMQGPDGVSVVPLYRAEVPHYGPLSMEMEFYWRTAMLLVFLGSVCWWLQVIKTLKWSSQQTCYGLQTEMAEFSVLGQINGGEQRKKKALGLEF